MGTSAAWNGASFNIAPAGANNVIQAAGQSITLPSRLVLRVDLLATGVNGNQANQTFTVNYSDGTLDRLFTEPERLVLAARICRRVDRADDRLSQHFERRADRRHV